MIVTVPGPGSAAINIGAALTADPVHFTRGGAEPEAAPSLNFWECNK